MKIESHQWFWQTWEGSIAIRPLLVLHGLLILIMYENSFVTYYHTSTTNMSLKAVFDAVKNYLFLKCHESPCTDNNINTIPRHHKRVCFYGTNFSEGDLFFFWPFLCAVLALVLFFRRSFRKNLEDSRLMTIFTQRKQWYRISAKLTKEKPIHKPSRPPELAM